MSMALLAGTANAADLTGKKIYINPGHGGYGATSNDPDGTRSDGTSATDRWVATIPYPNVCEEGFWESSMNLKKGLALRSLLQAQGATVYMSRTQNRGIDDRVLTEIGEEATSYGADMFLSIHTNANNSADNYTLTLFRGSDTGAKTDPLFPESKTMAIEGWKALHRNPVTYWTARKDESNPYAIADSAFYGTYHLGVLRRMFVPGYLAECTFHDYRPETHRLLSEDYNNFQAWQLYLSILEHFQADAPTTGVIIGTVKDDQRKPSDKNFPRNNNDTDRWLPINGAEVALTDGTTWWRTYTDANYNGLFYFTDLTPGTYTLTMTAQGYTPLTQTVTVTAGATAGGTYLLNDPSYEPASVNGVLNALAYDLKATGDNKISFRLNSDASVSFSVIEADGSLSHTTMLGECTKGLNEKTVPVEELPAGSYQWALTVTGPTTMGQEDPITSAVDNDNLFVPLTKGVMAINDQESPYFGHVLAVVPKNGFSDNAKSGVQLFDPQMNPLGYYNLGASWTGNSGPCKLGETGIDGKLLLADWTDGSNSGPWFFNYNDLTEPAWHMTGGTRNGDGLASEGGVNIGGSTCGAAGIVRDGKLYVYTADEDFPKDNDSGVTLLRYDDVQIGTTWTSAPSKVIGNWDKKFINATATLCPDRRGGLWICQNRWSNTATYPSVLHINANDELDAQISDVAMLNGSTAGAMGVSVDGTHIAVGSDTGVHLFDVTFDAAGKPTVTKTYDLNSPLVAKTYQLAYDAADNIYLVSSAAGNNQSGIAQYAMPKEVNSCTVHAPKTSMYTAGINDVIANQAVTEVARYNAAGQRVDATYQGVVIVRYSDGTAQKMINVK